MFDCFFEILGKSVSNKNFIFITRVFMQNVNFIKTF